MEENLIYIKDINFSNGNLSIVSDKSLHNLILVSNKLWMKVEVLNNTIDFNKLLLNYKNYLPEEEKYELHVNDDSLKLIKINKDQIINRDYICKDYLVYIDKKVYKLDIYINKLGSLKIRLVKVEKEQKLIVQNIQINNQQLAFELKFDSQLTQLSLTAEDVNVHIFDKKLNTILSFDAKNLDDNIFSYSIDMNLLSNYDVDLFNLSVILKGVSYSYVIEEGLEFKKIPVWDESTLKYIKVLTYKNQLNIELISDFTINPCISEISSETDVIFNGKLNYNCDFTINEAYNLKAIIISPDQKYELEKDIEVLGNKFEFVLTNNDILSMKDYSASSWKICIDVTYNEDTTRYDVSYINNKPLEIFKKVFFSSEENVTFRALINKNNKFILEAKNSITINQILYILQKKDRVKIKYRTKENIKAKLDKNQISTFISNKRGKLEEIKVKKVGKHTFISYYQGLNIDEFIEEVKKHGFNVNVKANEEYSVSRFDEIDNSLIFNGLWGFIQARKRYKSLCTLLYNKLFLKLPLKKNRILFESFLGRNVSGNPKYLYNQLVEDKLDRKYELIWILNDTNEEIIGRGKKVKRKSLMYYYYMATAKYWIFNCRQADEIKKRKGNIYLQTWHGTPLKKLAMDMDSVNMGGQTDIYEYKRKFYNNSRRWDYLLAQNNYSREIFKSAFAFDKTILDGYPANDILYRKNNLTDINKIKDKFGLPKDKKVILYAPTWRDDNFYKKGHYRMSIQLDLENMQKELGNEYIILLRMHYLITNNLNIEPYKGFVYDFSQGCDIQELYLVSDVLITDYSSVMFDYSNLQRPIIFFTYDIEQYRDSLRGFYFDFEEEAPGPLVVDTEGVIKSLKSLDDINIQYATKKKSFYDKFCHIDDGSAATNILKEILK